MSYMMYDWSTAALLSKFESEGQGLCALVAVGTVTAEHEHIHTRIQHEGVVAYERCDNQRHGGELDYSSTFQTP